MVALMKLRITSSPAQSTQFERETKKHLKERGSEQDEESRPTLLSVLPASTFCKLCSGGEPANRKTPSRRGTFMTLYRTPGSQKNQEK
jgi:hypothetical protein